MGERGRSRRRGEQLEGAILAAAWSELLEHGWADYSVPRVAARAGTGKASVYSRWPTRASLVVAAAVQHALTDMPARVPTGSLRGDLLSLLEEHAKFLAGPGGAAFRALASDPTAAPQAGEDPGDDDRVIKPILEIVAIARESGELGPGRIATRVLGLGPVMVNEHFFRLGAPPPAGALADMVDAVWAPALVHGSQEPAGE